MGLSCGEDRTQISFESSWKTTLKRRKVAWCWWSSCQWVAVGYLCTQGLIDGQDPFPFYLRARKMTYIYLWMAPSMAARSNLFVLWLSAGKFRWHAPRMKCKTVTGRIGVPEGSDKMGIVPSHYRLNICKNAKKEENVSVAHVAWQNRVRQQC